MSFFKNLLGLKKTSEGNKLSDYTNLTNQDHDDDDVKNLSNEIDSLEAFSVYDFKVEFVEKSLGVKLAKGSDGMAYIISSEPGSLAFVSDVRKTDKVIAVNGLNVVSYQSFLDIFSTAGRPIIITFNRNEAENIKMIASFTDSGKGDYSVSKPYVTATSDQNGSEKQRRRELMAKAAKERENQWDKRVAAASRKRTTGGTGATAVDLSGRPVYSHTEAATVGSCNPETQRIVSSVKRAEQQQAKSLGYNVFQPHLSFAGASSSNTSATADVASTSGSSFSVLNSNPVSQSSSSGALSDATQTREMAETVDDALALLMSGATLVDPADCAALALVEAQVDTAISTVMKMLTSLHKNKHELKYRSIRLMNDSFQIRVARVTGGLDLMLAAGFQIVSSSSSSSENNPVTNGNNNNTAAAVVAAAEEELYLRHDMTVGNEQRLDYTLHRLIELQTENSA